MRDLSLFLLKNSFALKMKRGIRSFCNGVGSTSTLDQTKPDLDGSCMAAPSVVGGSCLEEGNVGGSPLTLEEMILQLELEEEAAGRSDAELLQQQQRRMSCVNNADILRLARNALNQYPRFSLDGRDAMYRSSFHNSSAIRGERNAVCCSGGRRSKSVEGNDLERSLRLPPTLAGESVVWCKPGVVAKLMGLDAVPVPTSGGRNGKRRLRCIMNRRQSLRRMGRRELEKERFGLGMHACKGMRRSEAMASCSSANYCVMKPISVEPIKGSDADWHFARSR